MQYFFSIKSRTFSRFQQQTTLKSIFFFNYPALKRLIRIILFYYTYLHIELLVDVLHRPDLCLPGFRHGAQVCGGHHEHVERLPVVRVPVVELSLLHQTRQKLLVAEKQGKVRGDDVLSGKTKYRT